MLEIAKHFFLKGPFIPDGHCYLWKPELVWLHVASDAAIALAYYSIPLTLAYFVQQRKDAPMRLIFILFGAFIVCCGTTHVMEIWTLWHPDYLLSGFVKAITAVISIATAAILIPLMPRAIALPSLESVNLALLHEIGKSKQTEEALRASQARLSGILDIASDAIISVDISQQIQLFNKGAEAIFGYKAQEILGQPLDLLLPDRVKASHHKHVREFAISSEVAKRMAERQNIFGRRQDGTEFPAEASISKLKLRNEKFLTVILRDITERREAEEVLKEKNQQIEQAFKQLQKTQAQLVQSEKMSALGELVGGVAHEINNPVNFIYANIPYVREYTRDLITLLNFYQEQYPQPTPDIREKLEDSELDFIMEDLEHILDSIKGGADRIRDIVLSLRSFSRLDESERKTVDIHDGINSTLMILQSHLKTKTDFPEIEVFTEYGQLPPVECYPGQLNQVFLNVIKNAIDALLNCQCPKICIRTEAIADDWVAIRIADNGSGITEEVKSKLFDPFFTTKPVGKGTGLGLSISYTIIVEQHGGRLKCWSEPGGGTEFAIEIPIQNYSN